LLVGPRRASECAVAASPDVREAKSDGKMLGHMPL
jgi:hypothetical protein